MDSRSDVTNGVGGQDTGDGASEHAALNADGEMEALPVDGVMPRDANVDTDDARDSGVDIGGAEVVATPMFGSTCDTDEQCKVIGPTYFCLMNFQNAPITGGMCTRPCASAQEDCGANGACILEAGVPHTPLEVCLPTCKADVPCRTSFMCQFVYIDNMLSEPSICAPIGVN